MGIIDKDVASRRAVDMPRETGLAAGTHGGKRRFKAKWQLLTVEMLGCFGETHPPHLPRPDQPIWIWGVLICW